MAVLARPHGAFMTVETDGLEVPLESHPTRTRRGSRRQFASIEYRLVRHLRVPDPARYPDDAVVVVTRVEAGRVVRRLRIPLGGDEPLTGVREPRRPLPSSGGTMASASPGDD